VGEESDGFVVDWREEGRMELEEAEIEYGYAEDCC
jgi:hypothetical protein